LLTPTRQERIWHHGNNLVDFIDFVTDRSDAKLALQLLMGLLPKRRYRARFAYHHHLTGYGTDMRPPGRSYMKKYLSLLFLVSLAFSQSGCAFLGGAAAGTLATGAGYEINASRQMDRLEDDLRNERISRQEYESRKEQIERGSIIY
jgi:hypothetical protein